MKVRFISPRLGYKTGDVTDQLRVGICRTLVSFGVCVEISDDDKLDSGSDDKSDKPASNSKRGKKPSKAKSVRHNPRRKSDAADDSGDGAS